MSLPPRSGARGAPRRLWVFFGVLVGLPLLLEAGARLVLGDAFSPDVVTDIPLNGCVTFDETLGWKNPPDFRARAVRPSVARPLFEYDVSINSRGLRDREHAYEPAPGVKRILSMGDSFCWGWGVDDGESYSDLLEERLGAGFEVINLGVPGYGTDQELLQLEREGRRYAPDLVLLCFLLNDVEGNAADFLHGFGKPRLVRGDDGAWAFANLPVGNTPPEARRAVSSWRRGLRQHLAILKLLAPRRVSRPNDLALPEGSSDEELREVMKNTPWPFPLASAVPGLLASLRDPGSATYELLRRMQAACAGLGVPLVVFSIAPQDPYLFMAWAEPPAVAEAAAAGEPYRTELSRALAEVGAALGFHTLSVDQAMLEAVHAGDNLNSGDGHLDESGNAIVAGALEAWLRPRLAELVGG